MGAVLAAVGSTAIVALGAWWLRQRVLVHRYTPTVGRWLHIALPPRARWQPPQIIEHHVYLPITNEGGTAVFSAVVEHIEGTGNAYPNPFAIRWDEGREARCEIMSGATQRLHLVDVEPEGDLENYPIASGAATKASVKRLRYHRPGRFRFQGLQQEHVVYMDLRDAQQLETSWIPTKRMYQRQVRVSVRLRSADAVVNESQAVVIRIVENQKPKKPGESYQWGKDDAIVAELEATKEA